MKNMEELTDEEVEVLISLCEHAHHCGHQSFVVLRLLVVVDGLEEPS